MLADLGNDRQNPTNNYPEAIKEEFAQSLICDEILATNFHYHSGGDNGIDFFLSECDLAKGDRLNSGRVSGSILKKYDHLRHGFWYVTSLNPLTGETFIAQVKPVKPRAYINDGEKKIIKYETPKGKGTPFIYLDIPFRVIKRLAKKHHIKELPNDSYQEKWEWVRQHPEIDVTIAEGAKKAAALISCGKIAVACFSITTHSEKLLNQKEGIEFTPLKPELRWLFELGKRTVYIAFDRGDKSQKNVNKQSKTLGFKLQKRLNQQVMILDWRKDQGKGIDDFLKNNGIKEGLRLYKKALPFWRFTARLRAFATRKLSNAKQIEERYFQEYLLKEAITEYTKLAGIKSQQGTGKTEAVANFIKWVAEKHPDLRILVITHRRSLAKNLSNRFNIHCYLDDVVSLNRTCQGTTICLDSLLRIPDTVHYDFIIIDECEQVLWHLLSANTEIKTIRGDVLNHFQNLLSNSVNNGGKIIAMDADLSDLSMLTFSELIGIRQSEMTLFHNTYKPFINRKLFCYDSPVHLLDEIKIHTQRIKNVIKNRELAIKVPLKEGIEIELNIPRFMVSCGGQKVISTFGTTALNQYLINQGIPENKIAVIDKETIADPDHPCFNILNNPEKLKDFWVVIYSPTVSTGVSFDVKLVGHFDRVYGFYFGNYPVDDFEQQLERYRGDCDRHVFIAESSNKKIATGEAKQSDLVKHFYNKIKLSELALNPYLNMFCQKAISLYCSFASRINGDYQNLRNNFLEHEREKGYQIRFISVEKIKDLEEKAKKIKRLKKRALDAKENKLFNQGRYARELFESPTPDKERYNDLKQKKAKTKSERLMENRGDLENRYGDLSNLLLNDLELFTQFILADMIGLYPKLKRRFWSCMGFDLANHHEKERAKNRTEYLQKNNSSSYFLDEAAAARNSGLTTLINFLGIDVESLEPRSLLIGDEELAELKALQKKGSRSEEYLTKRNDIIDKAFSNENLQEWANGIYEKIKQCPTEFKTVFDINIDRILELAEDERNALMLYRMILARFGYHFELIGRYQIDGEQKRYYRLVSDIDHDLWQQIKDNWFTELQNFAIEAA